MTAISLNDLRITLENISYGETGSTELRNKRVELLEDDGYEAEFEVADLWIQEEENSDWRFYGVVAVEEYEAYV
jgi:hypothetical protein